MIECYNEYVYAKVTIIMWATIWIIAPWVVVAVAVFVDWLKRRGKK